MKAVSAKASFSEKAKKLFSTAKSSREVTSGVIAVRSKSGASFKAGPYTIKTEAPARRKG